MSATLDHPSTDDLINVVAHTANSRLTALRGGTSEADAQPTIGVMEAA
jgi:hypothetical protein